MLLSIQTQVYIYADIFIFVQAIFLLGLIFSELGHLIPWKLKSPYVGRFLKNHIINEKSANNWRFFKNHPKIGFYIVYIYKYLDTEQVIM